MIRESLKIRLLKTYKLKINSMKKLSISILIYLKSMKLNNNQTIKWKRLKGKL